VVVVVAAVGGAVVVVGGWVGGWGWVGGRVGGGGGGGVGRGGCVAVEVPRMKGEGRRVPRGLARSLGGPEGGGVVVVGGGRRGRADGPAAWPWPAAEPRGCSLATSACA
jgi:hypothetical protein